MGEIKHTRERAFFSSQGLCLLWTMFSELKLFPALSLFIVLGYSSQRCAYILLFMGSRFGPTGLETKARWFILKERWEELLCIWARVWRKLVWNQRFLVLLSPKGFLPTSRSPSPVG